METQAKEIGMAKAEGRREKRMRSKEIEKKNYESKKNGRFETKKKQQ